jgi:FAD/FMN-containing dehydrogenase
MSLIKSLRKVFNGKIIDQPTEMAAYLTDWRGEWTGQAIAVVQPLTTEEVTKVVCWCQKNQVAIVSQGGNTGLSGGATPSKDGKNIVLSLTKMKCIRNIDEINNTITVDAGVTLKTVQETADSLGKLFPLSLASEGSCTIGGNLATNAGGVQVLKYGNARDLCLGIEVVTPNGEIWDGLKGLRKNNTGYDLRDLYIGSEGTLGVITAATLKLFEKPRSKVVSFSSITDISSAIKLLKLSQKIFLDELTAFEIMSEACISLVEKHVHSSRFPLTDRSDWYILIELSSSGEELVLSQKMEDLLGMAIEQGLVVDAAISTSISQFNAIWAIRENISEAQGAEGKTIKHDISLPIATISQFIEDTNKIILERFVHIRMVVFGHLGDGNLHYNLSPSTDLDSNQSKLFTNQELHINKLVHDAVNKLNGSISAEHGLGVLRKDEASRYRSMTEKHLMATLKNAFDPQNIMNPGKFLD